MGAHSDNLTPLMRQYNSVKSQYPDKIVLFRMGDFYELFGEDAIAAAPVLGVALTSRHNGSDQKSALAGVPYHAIDKYLPRLLRAGHNVVVVEQVEDPRTAKGVVKREVVEILTPGSSAIEGLESPTRPNYLTSLCVSGEMCGLAYLDVSTGEFRAIDADFEEIAQRMAALEPSEVLVADSSDPELAAAHTRLLVHTRPNISLARVSPAYFGKQTAELELQRFFKVSSLDGFGVAECPLAVGAAAAILGYLRENHRDSLAHITRLVPDSRRDTMWLDHSSVRNLELVQSLTEGESGPNLFDAINITRTGPGARRLRRNLLAPFRELAPIVRRQDAVAEALANRGAAQEIIQLLSRLSDLERLAGRLGLRRLTPRQCLSLAEGLIIADQITKSLTSFSAPLFVDIANAMPQLHEFSARVVARLVEAPPHVTNQGGIFRAGSSPELDELQASIFDAKSYIAGLQESERQASGISSLKVGFNKIFGYYIEITNAHKDRIPQKYIRRQTLVNAERYITEEMKERETLILAAEEKINALEQKLFEGLLDEFCEHILDIQVVADCLAEIDVVLTLAELAAERGYVRPTLTSGQNLTITGGRHPVIERLLTKGAFVPNDIALQPPGESLMILTGPNMAGKSTYLRQIGHITLLAHIGSSVPADSATIGLVDRVFTRVGAVDRLAFGQSTFMVEMLETTNILHNATGQSLVLLDEIGRGTSTFDGLSIAWAVVEELAARDGARVIFATHYHEPTSLAENLPAVVNYQVAVKRWEDQVIFMHKIIPGGCDDSYGIEVAKLAGMPSAVVARAREILRELEHGKAAGTLASGSTRPTSPQISLFDAIAPSKVDRELRRLDPNTLTPLEALQIVTRWKSDVES